MFINNIIFVAEHELHSRFYLQRAAQYYADVGERRTRQANSVTSNRIPSIVKPRALRLNNRLVNAGIALIV